MRAASCPVQSNGPKKCWKELLGRQEGAPGSCLRSRGGEQYAPVQLGKGQGMAGVSKGRCLHGQLRVNPRGSNARTNSQSKPTALLSPFSWEVLYSRSLLQAPSAPSSRNTRGYWSKCSHAAWLVQPEGFFALLLIAHLLSGGCSSRNEHLAARMLPGASGFAQGIPAHTYACKVKRWLLE